MAMSQQGSMMFNITAKQITKVFNNVNNVSDMSQINMSYVQIFTNSKAFDNHYHKRYINQKMSIKYMPVCNLVAILSNLGHN